MIICAYFMKDKPDNAAFLQKHYGENGAGFYFGGEKVSLWYDAEGMRIARGTTAQRSISRPVIFQVRSDPRLSPAACGRNRGRANHQTERET